MVFEKLTLFFNLYLCHVDEESKKIVQHFKLTYCIAFILQLSKTLLFKVLRT